MKRKVVFGVLISLVFILGCSKNEKIGPTEQERNNMAVLSSAFVSTQYEYTDPGVIIGGTVIVPPSNKKRHTILSFNTNNTYREYYTPNGEIGEPWSRDGVLQNCKVVYPYLHIKDTVVSIFVFVSGYMVFELEGVKYTSNRKF